jgi:hypothetical protein
LQRAEATFSESCGNRAFVKKDLGCAYAAVGDSRAAAELTTHPSGDLTGVNFCRSLISLPPLTQ